MAKRRVKKIKRKVAAKRTNLTGFTDIDEFLKACLEVPFDEDELFKNLKTVATVLGVRKTVIVLRALIMRLFQYDDFYNLLMDDVETNLQQFATMRKMNIIGDEPEIVQAHKNMMVMSARLDEFATQMEEMSGQKLRKKTEPMKPVNVTKAAEKLARDAGA